MGGKGEVKDGAVLYLRIAALGAPLFMLASRGPGLPARDRRPAHPLFILVAAHIVNVVPRAAVRLRLRLGLKGSAWGTVIAQVGMAAAFFAVQYRAGPGASASGQDAPADADRLRVAVRTTALTGSFLVGTAVLARIGAASLGAHQIAFQLWVFLALVLDAIAIAGQVIVGRMLGAADADGARAAAIRMIGWSSRSARSSACSSSRSATSSRAVHRRPGGDRQGATRSGRCSR